MMQISFDFKNSSTSTIAIAESDDCHGSIACLSTVLLHLKKVFLLEKEINKTKHSMDTPASLQAIMHFVGVALPQEQNLSLGRRL